MKKKLIAAWIAINAGFVFVVSANVCEVEAQTYKVKRGERHQKTSPALTTQTPGLYVCKFGNNSSTYRVGKVVRQNLKECGILFVNSDQPELKLNLPREELSKLTQEKAIELFGKPSISTNAFSLVGWQGDGELEIFHLDMRFDNNGFCSRYRIRGGAEKISSKWVDLTEKKEGK